MRKRAQRQDWPAMSWIEVIDFQILQGLQRLLELAAIGAAAHQDRPAVQRDEGITADQFVAEGVVEAQAFGRVTGAGDNAPIGMIWQALHIFEPDIHLLDLAMIIGWEVIEVMQHSRQAYLAEHVADEHAPSLFSPRFVLAGLHP